jgi:hypothetical protein
MPAQASSYRGSLLDASRRPAFRAWAKREEASHRAARRDLRDLGARVLVGGAKPCPEPAAPCDGVGIVDLMVREARNYVETTRRTHP